MADLEKAVEFATAESNLNLFAVTALTAGIVEIAVERSVPVVSAIARNIKRAAVGAILFNVLLESGKRVPIFFPKMTGPSQRPRIHTSWLI